MKKLIALLLSALMLLTLCACTELTPKVETTAAPEPTETAETPAPAEETAPVEATPAVQSAETELGHRVTVNYENHAEACYDPEKGEQLILSFSWVTPHFRIEDRDEAAARINEYVAMLDETYYTGNDYGDGPSDGYAAMLEAAEDNYTYIVQTGAEGIPLEYSASRTAKLKRMDEQVINLCLETQTYTGGAHGSYVERSYVFDAETGERLSLDDLSGDPAALREGLVALMVAAATDNEYYAERIPVEFVAPEDYPQAFAQLLRSGSWYFDEQGLVIFSDLYELGPYAAGITEFKLPYADLAGLIDDRWLPAERSGSGEYELLDMADVADGSLVLLDRLVVDEEGEELCLSCKGTVYDVRVSSVYYAVDSFYDDSQLWSCSYMDDCALQLKCALPEGLPRLKISYTTADGESHVKLVSPVGADGGFALVDSDIQLLG